MDGTFVESDIDLGISGGQDSAPDFGRRSQEASSAVTGSEPVKPNGAAQEAVDTQGAQAEGVVQDGAQEVSGQQPTDDKVDWTTAPEHFRNSYEKNKTLRERAEQRAAQIEQDLEALRSTQGRGVYVSTDVPFEDFNPAESLAKMATEETEYHDALVDTVMQANFWPDVADHILALEGKSLGRVEGEGPSARLVFDSDEERTQFEQIDKIWDFLSRRVAGTDGSTMYRIVNTVAANPDIMQAIYERMNGGQGRMPSAGASGSYQQPQQGGLQQSQNQVTESREQIAQRLGYDLSEPAHVRAVDGIIAEQQRFLIRESQLRNEVDVSRREIGTLRKDLEGLKGGQQRIEGQSAEQAEVRAETRVDQFLSEALDKDIKENYAAAIPKDRPGLAERLKTLTKTRLQGDPNFQNAKTMAKKWLKQAATAASTEKREQCERKGLDALAVVTTLRATAMSEEARELLGNLSTKSAAAKQKTAIARSRVELGGGQSAPLRQDTSTGSKAGDIEGFRAGVRDRMRKAGVQMPG